MQIGPKQRTKKPMIYLATFILAFCSIVYELLLAQTLASTMGNTILRYNITIGLYLASLGVGSLYYGRWRGGDLVSKLIRVEIGLSIIGFASPILILLMDMLVRSGSDLVGISYRGFFPQTIVYVFDHGLIVAIGFLSGLELPLLIDIGNRGKRKVGNQVLATDYMGTLAGAVSFPLFLLPTLGVMAVANLVGLLNACIALVLVVMYRSPFRVERKFVLIVAVVALLCVGLLYRMPIQEGVIESLYFGG